MKNNLSNFKPNFYSENNQPEFVKEDAKFRSVSEGVDVGEDGGRDRNVVRLKC